MPPPDRQVMQPGGLTGHLPAKRLGYEGGLVRFTPNRRHALRPAGRSGAGERRLSLCGIDAFAVPQPFYADLPSSCRTCAMVERVRPSARPIRPSPDLAELRWRLDRAAIDTSRSPRSKYPRISADQALAELLAAV
ncbi:MAG: hypothetical protein ABIR32_16490 [Ilumatobacteraceae bacterium]